MNPEIPGYEILEVLGQGGMATVYLAKQLKFDRIVALKIMSPHLACDDTFKERFMHEARIVANISHPNIVAVYDVGEHDGHNYLSMEYHDGGDLKAKIEAGIDVKECLYIVKDICKALDFAHSNNIIHRDIKPDNILIRFDQSAVLTDFGIAKALESDNNLTQIGTAVGTPKYMSPEQTSGIEVSNQSDLYSVGVVLYEMLTGSAPYTAKDHLATAVMHYNEPIPTLPAASHFIQPLLNRLLAKAPKDRFASGKDVVNALNLLIKAYNEDKTVIMEAPAQTVVSTGLQPRKKQKVIGLSIVTAVILFSITWYALDTEPFALENKPKQSTVKATSRIVQTAPTTSANELAKEDFRDSDKQNEIASLLSQFEDLLATDRLKTPRDLNALLVTQKILLLDPNNTKALINQQRIGQRYLSLALLAADQNNFKKSQERLAAAAEFLSDDDTAETREIIQSKQANSGQQKVLVLRDKLRIQALLRQAKEDETERRITKPAGNNALQKYNEVLKIDPQNTKAKAGISRLTKLK